MSMALVQYPECGLEGEDFWKTQLLNDSILSRLSMITVKEITPHSTEVALSTKVHGKGVVSTVNYHIPGAVTQYKSTDHNVELY